MNCLLAEGIDHRSVGDAAIRANFVGNLIQLRLRASSKEKSGSLAGKGTGYCPTDWTARTVD
jgi:hypothetical protein